MFKTYTLLKRGFAHPDFCEDFLYTKQFSENLFLGAVFDGCSGGDNSHFASALAGKLMRNIGDKIEIEALSLELDKKLDDLLCQFFSSFYNAYKDLKLTQDDMLTTVIIFLFDYKTKKAVIRTFGDGFFAVDGLQKTIDHDNKPQYPIYFLEQAVTEEGVVCLDKIKSQKHIFSDVSDLSIASDGINTFRNDGQPEESNIPNPIEFLCRDAQFENLNTMLQRKYNILNIKYKIRNFDDIALIRLKLV